MFTLLSFWRQRLMMGRKYTQYPAVFTATAKRL